MGNQPMPFDPKVGAYILGEIAKGQRSLRSICSEEGLPDRSTIYGWVLDTPEFAAQYARARDIQQHGYADDIIYISDTEKDSYIARQRIDARKWTASRLLAKVYGDRIDHTHTGFVQSGNADLLARMTPEERETLRDILMTAAAREPEAAAPQGSDLAPAKRIGR